MSNRKRFSKTRQQRFRELETHLYLLWEARQLFSRDQERFKQIASELRILVCDQKASRRLLLSLMAQLGFQAVVNPPGPPFDTMPIAPVNWQRDRSWQKLADQVSAAAGDAATLTRLVEAQANLRRSMTLSEYVDTALGAC